MANTKRDRLVRRDPLVDEIVMGSLKDREGRKQKGLGRRGRGRGRGTGTCGGADNVAIWFEKRFLRGFRWAFQVHYSYGGLEENKLFLSRRPASVR